MKNTCKALSYGAALIAAFLVSSPASAGEKDKHDHDHGKEGHADHAKEAKGTGKASIQEISKALHENLACLEKELAAANHDVFHGCLESIEALGHDLIALKAPTDAMKKKRVNGYAKNLGRMAHQVDEYMDGKKPEKAKSQLKKLQAQVVMIESQFEELAKKKASGSNDKP
jgi:hypothetical protein